MTDAGLIQLWFRSDSGLIQVWNINTDQIDLKILWIVSFGHPRYRIPMSNQFHKSRGTILPDAIVSESGDLPFLNIIPMTEEEEWAPQWGSKKLVLIWNKSGSNVCKLSHLNAPGTAIPLTIQFWNLLTFLQCYTDSGLIHISFRFDSGLIQVWFRSRHK